MLGGYPDAPKLPERRHHVFPDHPDRLGRIVVQTKRNLRNASLPKGFQIFYRRLDPTVVAGKRQGLYDRIDNSVRNALEDGGIVHVGLGEDIEVRFDQIAVGIAEIRRQKLAHQHAPDKKFSPGFVDGLSSVLFDTLRHFGLWFLHKRGIAKIPLFMPGD